MLSTHQHPSLHSHQVQVGATMQQAGLQCFLFLTGAVTRKIAAHRDGHETLISHELAFHGETAHDHLGPGLFEICCGGGRDLGHEHARDCGHQHADLLNDRKGHHAYLVQKNDVHHLDSDHGDSGRCRPVCHGREKGVLVIYDYHYGGGLPSRPGHENHTSDRTLYGYECCGHLADTWALSLALSLLALENCHYFHLDETCLQCCETPALALALWDVAEPVMLRSHPALRRLTSAFLSPSVFVSS